MHFYFKYQVLYWLPLKIKMIVLFAPVVVPITAAGPKG